MSETRMTSCADRAAADVDTANNDGDRTRDDDASDSHCGINPSTSLFSREEERSDAEIAREQERWRTHPMPAHADDDDDSLFEQPPPRDDCPVCLIRLPQIHEQNYVSCCGKTLCKGCAEAVVSANSNSQHDPNLCPFCRGITSGSLEQLRKRVDVGDTDAMNVLACCFAKGSSAWCMSRDSAKAIELFKQASELGNIQASAILGDIYNPHFDCGIEIETGQRDWKKCTDYYKIAAKGGHDQARSNLGTLETNAGNVRVGMKHYMIAASAGHDYALAQVKKGYMGGVVIKDDFAKTLRAHKDAQDEMKSDHRKREETVKMREIG